MPGSRFVTALVVGLFVPAEALSAHGPISRSVEIEARRLASHAQPARANAAAADAWADVTRIGPGENIEIIVDDRPTLLRGRFLRADSDVIVVFDTAAVTIPRSAVAQITR